MSQLLIVCRSALLPGFQLAGVEAYAADDAAAAQKLIGRWLNESTAGLLAIDESLLAQIDTAFRRRMDAAQQLPYLALPSGEPLPPEAAAPENVIAEMIRKATGFHITFQREANHE